MSDIDRSLTFQARKFVTAANVHMLNTWIFLYEKSAPNSTDRKRYEKLLRVFIAEHNLSVAARLYAEAACSRSLKARQASDVLEQALGGLKRQRQKH